MRTPLLAALTAAFILSACSDLPTSPALEEVEGSPEQGVEQGVEGGGEQGEEGEQGVDQEVARLYVAPGSRAASQAAAWSASRPADAALMDRLAGVPQALWFGDWTSNVADALERATRAAEADGALPVLVAYNIPHRDCGGLSGGGGADPGAYRSWIASFAAGIAGRQALVILEPDALAAAGCLSASDFAERMKLLHDAVVVLKQNPGTRVYVDAGHAHWLSPAEAARRLREAGIAAADGFSLNVSNFFSDADNVAYGREVSRLLGGKNFVIDSSRNGLGPTADKQWCNPSGRALGREPTLRTGQDGVDGFLWIKVPGESDGACNGGPTAGHWWADYALGLAQRAGW